MADALIENPILNSPFIEPDRHFKFTDEGITNEVVLGRRSSSYFIPIARPKKKGKQLAFDTEWTQDRIEENKTVNRIRQRVGMWREAGHVGVTPATAGLLRYWSDPNARQVVFLPGRGPGNDHLHHRGRKKVRRRLGRKRSARRQRHIKPRTVTVPVQDGHGLGKDLVMAMLIAWQASTSSRALRMPASARRS